MSTTALERRQQRGTKRSCMGCDQRFYDLGRDPVICPLCQTSMSLSEYERSRNAGYGGSDTRGAYVSRQKAQFRIVDAEEKASPVTSASEEGVAEDEVSPSSDDEILEQEDADEDLTDLVDPDATES